MKTISDILKNQSLFAVIITTCWLAYAEPRIHEIIKEDVAQRKGGLGSELTNKFDIKRENVADKLHEGIVWVDSLKLMYRTIYPMLQEEYRTFDVGLKVDKFTKEVRYVHIDGRTYYPSIDTNGFYYFMNTSGRSEYCK